MPIDSWLIDDMINAYVDWREQCRRVERAYAGWSTARRPDVRLRFAAYLAEIDQEDRAVETYANAVTRVALGRVALGDEAATGPRTESDSVFRAA
jgi:hypothetical protein